MEKECQIVFVTLSCVSNTKVAARKSLNEKGQVTNGKNGEKQQTLSEIFVVRMFACNKKLNG